MDERDILQWSILASIEGPTSVAVQKHSCQFSLLVLEIHPSVPNSHSNIQALESHTYALPQCKKINDNNL